MTRQVWFQRRFAVAALSFGFNGIGINWQRTLPGAIASAISLTAMLLLLVFIRHIVKLEANVPDQASIFAYETTAKTDDGQTIEYALTPWIFRDELLKSTGAIIKVTHAFEKSITLTKSDASISEKGVLIDTYFFDVFRLPFLSGAKSDFFGAKNQIVLSESFAKQVGLKVGDKLQATVSNITEKYVVSGIVKDMPYPTQNQWRIFIPLTAARASVHPDELASWTTLNIKTYARIKSGHKLKNVTRLVPRQNYQTSNLKLDIRPIPIKQLFFQSKATDSDTSKQLIGQKILFKAFCILLPTIFILAVLAYINATSAQISSRAPEISLRKLYGANKMQIMRHFYLETAFVFGLGALLAFCLSLILLPIFSNIVGVELRAEWFKADGGLALLFLMTLLLTLAAGLYTALKLTSVTLDVAVRNAPYEMPKRSNKRSQIIVMLQFLTGTAALAMAIISHLQMNHAENFDMGFDVKNSLIISGIDSALFKQHQEILEKRLGTVSLVTGIGYASYAGEKDDVNSIPISAPTLPQQISISWIAASQDYFNSLKVPLLAGNLEDYSLWSATNRNVVVNRRMASILGYATPSKAIGGQFFFNNDAGKQTVTIVAVVEDVRLDTLRTPLQPLYYINRPEMFKYMLVGSMDGREQSARIWLKDIWKEVMPDTPLQIRSYAAQMNEAARQDKLFDHIVRSLSFVFGMTSLIAFWGLCQDIAVRRKLEYTLHYLYGAKWTHIFRYMCRSLASWVMAGISAGLIIALYLGRHWLAGFDVQINLPWGVFATAVILLAIVLLFTVSIHVRHLSRQDLAETLKYE